MIRHLSYPEVSAIYPKEPTPMSNDNTKRLILPGVDPRQIIKPGPEVQQCPMCAELRQAVEHARGVGDDAIRAAVLAKQAAEVAQDHQVKMQATLVQLLTLVYEVAAFPADGQPDIEPEDGSIAAKARALILALP